MQKNEFDDIEERTADTVEFRPKLTFRYNMQQHPNTELEWMVFLLSLSMNNGLMISTMNMHSFV